MQVDHLVVSAVIKQLISIENDVVSQEKTEPPPAIQIPCDLCTAMIKNPTGKQRSIQLGGPDAESYPGQFEKKWKMGRLDKCRDWLYFPFVVMLLLFQSINQSVASISAYSHVVLTQ